MRSIQDFIDDGKKIGRVSIEEANNQTLKILNENYYDEDWEINSRIKAYDILDMTLGIKHNGNPDDFHNYAVTFARINDYDAACDIIKSGLKKFPFNIDLIADFLEYAPENSDENRFAECEEYYEKLKNIEINTWTWRAFSFAIDYLLAKSEQDINEIKKIICELNIISNKYLEIYSMDERAYFSAYIIDQRFKNKYETKDTLEKAISLPIRAAHCALKLAELFFEKKEYDKSLLCLNRALNDGIDQYGGINMVNIYLLRFSIKVSMLMNSFALSNNTRGLINDDIQEKIKDAYKDYQVANGLGIDFTKKKSFKQYKKLLELTSGVPNSEDSDEIE